MKFMTTTCLLGASAILLSACGQWKIDQAQKTMPHGDAFQTALYAGYLDLARQESAESDFWDDAYFADRAAASAAGNPPLPERIADRRLPADTVADLTGARGRLISSFVKDAKTKAPADAATAQVNFDCWMQEQEENLQPNDIARCRGGFENAMHKIDVALAPKPAETAEKATPAPAPVMPEKPMAKSPPKTFTLFFGFDSAVLDEKNMAVLRDAAAEARKSGITMVDIRGFADRAGPGDYNMTLSERRSAAVAEVLKDYGISSGKISTEGYGENRPQVPTADGQREPRNRRVEISYLER